MKPVLKSLWGEFLSSPPIWLMRQAGRYLPEYRAVRKQYNCFMNLCYTPEVAAQVTLQPIERFGFDAAIIFSDILVIPDALGQKVSFRKDHGPVLSAVDWAYFQDQAPQIDLKQKLHPVLEALQITKSQLPPSCTLIGFAGAPWTLATYMIENGKSVDFSQALFWLSHEQEKITALLDQLVQSVGDFLVLQIEAGAEVLQIFDSWASVVPNQHIHQAIIVPVTKIIDRIHRQYPHTPIIYYSRGLSHLYTKILEGRPNVAVSVDHFTPVSFMKTSLQPHFTVQGNLSPDVLYHGGEQQRLLTENILNSLGHAPFIFNLGHGILPQTPVDHVYRLVDQVRQFSCEQS